MQSRPTSRASILHNMQHQSDASGTANDQRPRTGQSQASGGGKAKYTQEELEEYRQIDADGNGEIDFEEFCDCMKKMTTKKHTDDEIIRDCFQVFDQDGNGVVSHAEWKHVLRDIGGFSEHFADELFQEIDIAGNGHLDYEEFAMMVRSYMFDEDDKRSSI